MIQEVIDENFCIFAFLVEIDIARPIHPIGWSVLFVNNGLTKIAFKTLVFNYELTILHVFYSVFCIIFFQIITFTFSDDNYSSKKKIHNQ